MRFLILFTVLIKLSVCRPNGYEPFPRFNIRGLRPFSSFRLGLGQAGLRFGNRLFSRRKLMPMNLRPFKKLPKFAQPYTQKPNLPPIPLRGTPYHIHITGIAILPTLPSHGYGAGPGRPGGQIYGRNNANDFGVPLLGGEGKGVVLGNLGELGLGDRINIRGGNGPPINHKINSKGMPLSLSLGKVGGASYGRGSGLSHGNQNGKFEDLNLIDVGDSQHDLGKPSPMGITAIKYGSDDQERDSYKSKGLLSEIQLNNGIRSLYGGYVGPEGPFKGQVVIEDHINTHEYHGDGEVIACDQVDGVQIGNKIHIKDENNDDSDLSKSYHENTIFS